MSIPYPTRQREPAWASGAKWLALPLAKDALIILVICAFVSGAWWVVQVSGLKSASETGYWLGVAGGILMLLLFAYPLRKRVRFMAGWGAAKWWFMVHMALGVFGPTLVLVHSTFQIGSLNAGVALYSMLIVAASGVVGRFLYSRTARGLRDVLQVLAVHSIATAKLWSDGSDVSSSSSGAMAQLSSLEDRYTATAANRKVRLASFLVLPFQVAILRRTAVRECLAHIQLKSHREGWDERRHKAASLAARQQIRDYTYSLLQAAQFGSAARLFSLWHVLHVPFVYVMVLCAVVHVVAVHVY